MDANNDIRKGKISKTLEEISVSEAIVKLHKDKVHSLLVKPTQTVKLLTASGLPMELIFFVTDSPFK